MEIEKIIGLEDLCKLSIQDKNMILSVFFHNTRNINDPYINIYIMLDKEHKAIYKENRLLLDKLSDVVIKANKHILDLMLYLS